MILQDNGSVPIYTRMLRCGLDLDGFSDVPISNGFRAPLLLADAGGNGSWRSANGQAWHLDFFEGDLTQSPVGSLHVARWWWWCRISSQKKSLPRSSHGKSWSNRELQDVSLANLPNQRPKSPDTSEARRCFDRCSFHYQGLDGLLRSGLEDFRLHRLHGPCR